MDLERIDFLDKIGCSQAEITDIETFVAKLERKQLWDTMQKLACEVMAVHPCGNILRASLEKVENMEADAGIHKYSLDLLLIIECALILKKDFEKRVSENAKVSIDDKVSINNNVSMEIFYDSMKDITYKMHECQDVYGITGIFVGFWYDGFFDMTRFALGRLQFEIMPLWLSETISVWGLTLENGMEAINVHIPSSGPLVFSEAQKAFAMAAEFFRDRFVGRPVVFVMASWLLDEDLMVLLPDGNIKEFVKHFRIINTNKSDSFDDGWRVFGKDWSYCAHKTKKIMKEDGTETCEDCWRAGIAYLPRNTRLQRAIVDYLQQGGRLGYGYGVIVGKI